MFRAPDIYIYSKRFRERLSPDMYVFQQPDVLRRMMLSELVHGLRTRTFPVTYSVYEGKELRMMLPMMYSKGRAVSYGDSGTSAIGRLNPIYFKESSIERKSYFEALYNAIQSRNILLTRVEENSPISELLASCNISRQAEVTSSPCVRIDFRNHQSFDEYFSSLSKSVRQNIRTGYNRLEKSGSTLRYKEYQGAQIPRKILRRVIEVYLTRKRIRYPDSGKRLDIPYYYLLDSVFRSLKHDPKMRLGILYINEDVAAFYCGHLDEKRKTIYIPRLAINHDYARYSPGYLLVVETIRQAISEKNYTVFDLLLGTEQYKLDLGGDIYARKTYAFMRG